MNSKRSWIRSGGIFISTSMMCISTGMGMSYILHANTGSNDHNTNDEQILAVKTSLKGLPLSLLDQVCHQVRYIPVYCWSRERSRVHCQWLGHGCK